MTPLIASLMLFGPKPPLTAVMDAERALAAGFAKADFAPYRRLFSTDFRFYPNGGLKPAGKAAYIESMVRYRKTISNVRQTVRLISSEVKGDEVRVTIEIHQTLDTFIGGKVRSGGYTTRMNDTWRKTGTGYKLASMKPAFKGPAVGAFR